ncbi:squalene/phytoene synthase family protein [Actinomadura litoris]|uniref:squalene/phytoene synthase family protein n=1 Tax=Actinomadura litoris TaxID=2678616 RepID=UPI001FA7A68A|nr:squalene/phytoene synthase family protein [Actinomadura litoris]
MKSELDAAGLHDPRLRAAYADCARFLRSRNSAAYPAARALLPPSHRPYWDAILAFTTYVDDVLDDPDVAVAERTVRYERYTAQFHMLRTGEDPWPSEDGRPAHLARAFAHFSTAWRIPEDSVRLFLDTISTDLHVTQYETFAELAGYVHGVCAQGSQWGGLLFHPRDEEAAAAAAEAMSFGLQLTDYLRDLREDLHDGRLYIPVEDLDRFGLTREGLERTVRMGRTTPALRDLVEFQVRRAREYLDKAAGWWRLVHPSMRELPRQYVALARASTEQIVRDGYDVLRPSRRHRAATAFHAAVVLKAAGVRGRATRLLHPAPPPVRAPEPGAPARPRKASEWSGEF